MEGRWREDGEKMLVSRRLSLNTRLTNKVDLYRADDIGGVLLLRNFLYLKLHKFMDSRYLLNSPASHFSSALQHSNQIGKQYISHTHIHTYAHMPLSTDHTSGLTSSWSHPIHCTPTTAKLLKKKFDINPKLVVCSVLYSSRKLFHCHGTSLS